eukprot:TRINITY_DN64_c0_g2_i1.p1 TRINITY_DN64_c0_g2~~TRINITY_DN64_c0_g2_i1.p1  ORF type:complete len:269 (-),score=73.36 TRINITY_DN64_c0_g2_i1:404-1210(-)
MCIRDRYQRRVRGSLEIAMSLRSGHVKSKRDPLQQKIPQNPKYDHVRSSLDTGCSVTKWMSKNGDSCRPKKDEFFKRIRGSQLVELMDEEDIEEESVYNLASEEDNKTAVHAAGDGHVEEAFFLLLDLRGEEEYAQGHIRMAMHYPHTQLHHATNYFTPEIYRYKNRADRMIVLYGDDDKIAATAGSLFVEKGVENVFVLTGGLQRFVVKFEEYVSGEVPDYGSQADDRSSCSGRSTARSMRSQMSRMSSMPPPGSARSRVSTQRSMR